MNEGYIEEKTWVKCTIDDIVYDCYFEYHRCTLYSKPWVDVTVRKYVTKKWWIFRWREEEFECDGFPELNSYERIWVNKTLYFRSEYVKDWVQGALNRRESKTQEKKLEIERQKNLKVLKEI